MEEEIKEEFLKSHTFSRDYSLHPSKVVSSWEVYYLNRQLDDPVVRDAEMDGFLGHLQNEQAGTGVKKDADSHVYSFKEVDMVLGAEDGDTNNVILGTPTEKSQKLQLDIYDSAHKTNGNIFSSERKSKQVT
ncbi:uncharacterized protein LOC120143237 [Hibiscus syriacus]|uniref:uncharacterized protein LOC120143237 n=1 Tax=Hibiscus syriacus TaxID=106335 RepID=UPI001921CACE|nr:uncharacterized protein LOC120143237 [Hibiscus syriacus]